MRFFGFKSSTTSTQEKKTNGTSVAAAAHALRGIGDSYQKKNEIPKTVTSSSITINNNSYNSKAYSSYSRQSYSSYSSGYSSSGSWSSSPSGSNSPLGQSPTNGGSWGCSGWGKKWWLRTLIYIWLHAGGSGWLHHIGSVLSCLSQYWPKSWMKKPFHV